MSDRAQSSAPPASWKWILCAILFFATVLNYLDRQTLGLCKSKIVEEFHLTNENYGELLAAFRWTYAAMHLPAGFVADHFSLRFLFALGVAVWSMAGASVFWVKSLGVFKIARAGLGLGEAVNWPFSTRIVSNMFSREDRGLGIGIFNSGSAIGALAAPLIITPLASAWGWRWPFLLTGLAGVLWIVLWLWFTRSGRAVAFDNPKQKRAVGNLAQMAARSFGALARHPGAWLLILSSVTINPCWYFCCDWTPGYLAEHSGFSFLRAGLLVTVVFLGGDIGNYLGGAVVKLLNRANFSVTRARAVACVTGAILASCMALIPSLPNPYFSLAALAAAAVGINMIVPNHQACHPEVSFANTAQLAGVTGFAANVFAALVNPRIGRYVDIHHAYDLVFYLVALFPWITTAALITFGRVVRPEVENSKTVLPKAASPATALS